MAKAKKARRTAPARRAASAADDTNATNGAQTLPASDTTTDAPPAHEIARTEALNSIDAAGKDDEGPADAREYFARCNLAPTVPATLQLVAELLEHFGVLPRPKAHADTGW